MADKQHACETCQKRFATERALADHTRDKHGELHDMDTAPDWGGECEVCGMSPIVPLTGLCGPCTWGEAETIGGNW